MQGPHLIQLASLLNLSSPLAREPREHLVCTYIHTYRIDKESPCRLVPECLHKHVALVDLEAAGFRMSRGRARTMARGLSRLYPTSPGAEPQSRLLFSSACGPVRLPEGIYFNTPGLQQAGTRFRFISGRPRFRREWKHPLPHILPRVILLPRPRLTMRRRLGVHGRRFIFCRPTPRLAA